MQQRLCMKTEEIVSCCSRLVNLMQRKPHPGTESALEPVCFLLFDRHFSGLRRCGQAQHLPAPGSAGFQDHRFEWPQDTVRCGWRPADYGFHASTPEVKPSLLNAMFAPSGQTIVNASGRPRQAWKRAKHEKVQFCAIHRNKRCIRVPLLGPLVPLHGWWIRALGWPYPVHLASSQVKKTEHFRKFPYSVPRHLTRG